MNAMRAHYLVKVEATAFEWMTVHGNLCLALRHPQNRGPSREACMNIVRKLSKAIVESGLLTQQEMDQATALERQEGTQL